VSAKAGLAQTQRGRHGLTGEQTLCWRGRAEPQDRAAPPAIPIHAVRGRIAEAWKEFRVFWEHTTGIARTWVRTRVLMLPGAVAGAKASTETAAAAAKSTVMDLCMALLKEAELDLHELDDKRCEITQ